MELVRSTITGRVSDVFRNARRALMLLPSGAIFGVLFLAPICYFLVISFWQVRAYRLRPDFTLTQYARVFSEYWKPIVTTFSISLLIATMTVVIAYAFSYFCRFRAGRYGQIFLSVALLTLFGGYLTKIYTWKIILGEAGLLNSALLTVGLIDVPIRAFLYNWAAVILTLVHYTLPLAILPIYGALKGVKEIPLAAAQDLGASKLRVFWDIVLPQTRIGLLSAFALSFVFAVGDYTTPLLVGGPNSSMIGLFIQSQFGHRVNAPLGAAMSFVVMMACIAFIAMAALLLWKATRPRT